MQQPSVAQQSVAVEKPQVQTAQATTTVHNGSQPVPGGEKIYETPLWVTIVRGCQLFIGLVIMILAGILIHGVLINDWAFALVCVGYYVINISQLYAHADFSLGFVYLDRCRICSHLRKSSRRSSLV